MKTKKLFMRWATLFVAMFCSFAMYSCSDDDDNGNGDFGSTEFDGSSIVGKWEISKVQISAGGKKYDMNVDKNAGDGDLDWEYEIYTLTEDGKVSYESWYKGESEGVEQGTYTYNESTHKVSLSFGETYTVQSLTKKYLTLTTKVTEKGETFTAILVYKRIG